MAPKSPFHVFLAHSSNLPETDQLQFTDKSVTMPPVRFGWVGQEAFIRHDPRIVLWSRVRGCKIKTEADPSNLI
jgi:hypothetical protein